MSMNSFSFKAEKSESRSRRKRKSSSEEEISQLLNLHPEGEAFPIEEQLKTCANSNFQPIDLEKIREERQDPNERRNAPRYDLKLTVLIANHCKAFRTQSQNVSATGLLLKDLLPEEFSNHLFDIVLIQTNDKGEKTFFVFRGRAISGRMRSRQVKFEALTRDSEAKLQEALENLEVAA